MLCPVYTCLSEVAEVVADSNLALGAQDLYWVDEGAFTGEVSAPMLKDAGCAYVIIGHSERRQFFNETNETVNKKVKAALKSGLLPIVCVGESLAQREANKTFEVLADHVNNGLAGLSAEEVSRIVVAYEPVWAIGTGKTATWPRPRKRINISGTCWLNYIIRILPIISEFSMVAALNRKISRRSWLSPT